MMNRQAFHFSFATGICGRTVLSTALAAALLAACGGGNDSSMSTYGGGSNGSGGSGASGTSYTQTALVADTTGAAHADTHLVNAWGVAFNPSGYVWVANNGTNTSTLYDGNGVPQSLVVTIPAGTAGSASPTGIVYNGSSTDFAVSQGSTSGASAFIFAGEGGTISGWSPAVSMNAAITTIDDAAGGAVYKGLTLASRSNASFLYAADFHNNRIAVFDSHFAPAVTTGGFTDPNLPAGYAPFNIQAIGGKLYVAYAQQDATAHDEVAGAGLGIVDVYDTDGVLQQRLITGGQLNAPWGFALAPTNFGPYSGDLLVGNFGDGKINAFNPATGAYAGTLSTAAGAPIVIDGLWGIAFGNGINAQPTNTLFYAAGPGNEAHGAYGRIDVK